MTMHFSTELLTSKTGLDRIRIKVETLPNGNSVEEGRVFCILGRLGGFGALPWDGLAPTHTTDCTPLIMAFVVMPREREAKRQASDSSKAQCHPPSHPVPGELQGDWGWGSSVTDTAMNSLFGPQLFCVYLSSHSHDNQCVHGLTACILMP